MNRYTFLLLISLIILFSYIKYILNLTFTESLIPVILAGANWILGGQKTKEDVRNENIQQEYNLLKNDLHEYISKTKLKYWVESSDTDSILGKCIYPKKKLESKRNNLKSAFDNYSAAWSRYSNSRDPITGEFVVKEDISQEVDITSDNVIKEWNRLIKTYHKILNL